MRFSLLSLGAAALLLPLAAHAFPAYTNHAGVAVSALPIAVEAKYVTLSNAAETVRIPLSTFPESEARRIAADYARRTGDLAALRIPADVRGVFTSHKKAIHRSAVRAQKGLCTEEQSAAAIAAERATLTAYLDKQLDTLRITPAEYTLLRATY